MKKIRYVHDPIRPPILILIQRELDLGAFNDGDEFCFDALRGDCSGQVARNITILHCRVRQLNLQNAWLEKLQLSNCEVEHCDFSGAQMEKAHTDCCQISDCRLLGANFNETRFDNVVLTGCLADGAWFSKAKFRAVRFVNCSLRAADFEGADLSGVRLKDCDLSGATLTGAKLAGTDFRGSTIDGLAVTAADLRGAIFTSAQAVQVSALLGIVIEEEGREAWESPRLLVLFHPAQGGKRQPVERRGGQHVGPEAQRVKLRPQQRPGPAPQ